MNPSMFFVATVFLMISGICRAADDALPNPDLTRGEAVPEGATRTWNLGPTGARGWMHADRLVTTQARQILVTEVSKGSPADGILMVGDVILGVEGQDFKQDPRVELGRAVTGAEASTGTLRLRIWRDGRTSDRSLRLAVLGRYSRTAPFDCAKSARILTRGCEALARRVREKDYAASQNPITRSLNALALLAGGDPNHLPLVRREAEWAAGFETRSFQVWWYAYVMMLLAEYQDATGDDSFQDGLRRLAMEAAKGQSIVGSWGHGFAEADGRLGGYGMMNAAGVPLTISLLMADKAGVEDPAIGLAIDRSAKLIRFYAGKGAVPYGDHAPWTQTHEDNGKCGMAAVLFNLMGEAQPTEFFTRMSVASHGPERDTGHTGNFTNLLWSMPAISLAGPEATGGWMQEFGSWYFDLARTWDYRFPHPGPPEKHPDSYHDWDATGAYLLGFAMPGKKLWLTGKHPGVLKPFGAGIVSSLLRDGRGWSNVDRNSAYDALDQAALMERLASWSPTVRERAAMALARKAGEQRLPVDALIKKLGSPSIHARYGACVALKSARDQAVPAVPALIELLGHEDLWLRCLAADALAHLGEAAAPAIPILLERLALGSTEADPRGMEQRFISFAVFGGMLRHSLDHVDRDALKKAIVAGLKNQDGRARGAIGTIYGRLKFEELQPLLPAIHEAIVRPAPSGIMFADQVRISGLELLAKHRVEEGIDAAVGYLRDQNRWASEKRTPELLKIIESYGVHAQRVIPRLLDFASEIEGGEPDFPTHLSKQKTADIRASVERIRAATQRPELIRIQ